ncbi:helix-turn-helix transcriptional regulator [Paenibacillus sp. FSL R7-0337]|uniref:helix-turn-helix domain-containing protein n=1 Tax=Paenibacillus sp. FSL R7-0337 TaxID=1926588 RepID=UPI0009FA1C39|nr:helix-turn-helix transcriptional regulator [Paenibacillus sp. FSL R7-0337]
MVATIATIRDALAMYLSQQGMSIHQFSIHTGINSGTLSRLLKGQQPIAMDHLVRITQGMELPEDHFYSLYVDECFLHSPPTWRRLRPFLLRSAELGRLDCIEQVVQQLLEKLTYAPMLFEVAEGLFQEGQWQAAALLYKNVSDCEKYQNSERLAVCQYRLFRIALGDNQTRNLQAAHIFECYLNRLDEADQLDGIKNLVNVYYSLHKWEKADKLAQDMLHLAMLRYNLQRKSNRRMTDEKKSEKPLCFYIYYSHLMRASICEEHNDYKSALKFVSLYTDTSWIQKDDKEAKRTIAQFQEWGKANTLLYQVMSGKQEVLSEYIEHISTQRDELFVALSNILTSANRFGWNVDHVLEQFAAYIPYQTYATEFGGYNQQIMSDQHTKFLAELAAYHLHNKRKEGIQFIIQSLESSARINNESTAIKCADLFGKHRDQADEKAQVQYNLQIGPYL